MAIFKTVVTCTSAIREFIAPTYRPERHYMRGPGPACARRVAATVNRSAVLG